eukprot:3662159-Rhodomonas_salina.1
MVGAGGGIHEEEWYADDFEPVDGAPPSPPLPSVSLALSLSRSLSEKGYADAFGPRITVHVPRITVHVLSLSLSGPLCL